MTLNITIPAPTPLTVQLGNITAPGAITPAAGQATLADFLFNTFSQNLRTAISSGPFRRLNVGASTSQPVFVAVGGRWGKMTSSFFALSTNAGVGYMFIVVNADGTLSLRVSTSGALNAFELFIGTFYDTGTAISWVDVGGLGLASTGGRLTLAGSNPGLVLSDTTTATGATTISRINGVWTVTDSTNGVIMTLSNAGLVALSGASAGVQLNDRAGNGRSFAVYRNSDALAFVDSVNGTGMTLGNTGAAIYQALATSATPLTAKNMAGQTADIAQFDGTAVTNGQKTLVDKNGHLYATQAAAPTVVAGAGAGTGGSVALVAGSTDQCGIIGVTVGTAPPGANSLVATINFRNAWVNPPKVVFLPYGGGGFLGAQNLARNQDIAQGTTSTTAVNIVGGTAALAAGGSYQWAYFCFA